MDRNEQEQLERDAPKRYADDHEGSRVLASFGGTLTLVALLILAAIAIIWWLAAR